MTLDMTQTDDIPALMADIGARAKAAAATLGFASADQKQTALEKAADALIASSADILDANAKDLEFGRDKGLSDAMMDRLLLDDARISAIADSLRSIAAQDDPVGQVLTEWDQPTGLNIQRVRTPLGVIGVIYESRPNVTADAGALCLKAGNAVILRGGSEAINANQAIAECIREGLRAAGLPEAAVQVVETTDRAAVGELITHPEYVDVIVPRGGKGLIERISNDARVPVIKHLDGNCHTYIDEQADIAKAISVAFNAKTQRYGTCNTTETLLVANAIAQQVLPELAAQYRQAGVELRGCEQARDLLESVGVTDMQAATEADWEEEYLAPVLAVKIVKDIDEAIEHINRYSSGHTEAIITENYTLARRFLTEVDSSSVMVNASTRFADGFEYGLGAEIGISTDKIHARGPVGLEGLTSQKWVVLGDGHIRL